MEAPLAIRARGSSDLLSWAQMWIQMWIQAILAIWSELEGEVRGGILQLPWFLERIAASL